MELTFPHKYMKNTSTCGMIHTEQLQNAGRRPQTSERARKSSCNWVGQKKKEKKNKERERKESGWEQHPREGAVKEERFLHPRKFPHWQGDQLGWRGIFRALEENTVTSLQKAKQRMTFTDGQYYHPCFPG